MHYGELISRVALCAGALMGLGALIAPGWAASLVRLTEDPAPTRPGGFSEFRATYGGFFLLTHLGALLVALYLPSPYAFFAALPLALGWIGAGIGRLVSLAADRSRNRATGRIPLFALLELVVGLAIGCNTFQFIALIRQLSQ